MNLKGYAVHFSETREDHGCRRRRIGGLCAGQKAKRDRAFWEHCVSRTPVLRYSAALIAIVCSLAGTLSVYAATHALTATPSSISFGSVLVGKSKNQTVTLSNTGTATIKITQATVTGTGFRISGLSVPKTLSARSSTTFTVTFAPTRTGTVTGSVSITANGSYSIIIALSGTGITQLLSANPTGLSFGSVAVGGSSTKSVTLTSTGTVSVTISQATVTGSGFSISGLSLPRSLAPGQSVSFSVRFAPTVSGSLTGTVSVASNATNSPTRISLSGGTTSSSSTGTLSVTPTSLNFGNVLVGSNNILPETLRNGGTVSLTVSLPTVTGAGFSISGLTFPLILSAGGSASLSVKFAPTTTGSVVGNLALVSTGSNPLINVTLSGTGVKSHYVSLSWTASTSSNIVGYNLYRGSVSGGPYAKVNSSSVGSTTYTDSSVLAGQTYYYVATAVNSSNVESGYSNQSTAVVPSP